MRPAVSSENGDYILTFLPPGDYGVRAEISGFKSVDQRVTVAAAQTVPLSLDMQVSGVTETVTVLGTVDAAQVWRVQLQGPHLVCHGRSLRDDTPTPNPKRPWTPSSFS